LIKLAALAFVLSGRITYIINFQLLGGIWILQTLPAIVFGLYRRRLAAPALLAGWVAGTVVGTLMAIARGSVYPLHIAGLDLTAYAAIDALVVNLVIATACQLFSHPLARIQDGGQQPRQPSSGPIKLAVNDSH
jgi:SSS family solute:Na+ symporter